MKKKTLFDRLAELAAQASRHIDWLNCGGCGVFAHMVGDRLYRMPPDGRTSVELLGYAVNGWCRIAAPLEVAGARPTTVDLSIEELRPRVVDRWCARSWHRAGLKLRHIGVELHLDGTDYIFDSNGLWPSDEHPEFDDRVPGRLERTEMLLMALQPMGWNSDFDRQQLPFMKELIRAFLPYPGEERQYERLRARLRKPDKAPKTRAPIRPQWTTLPNEAKAQYHELRALRREISHLTTTSTDELYCEVA